MTSRQRVQTALNHQQPDRVPIDLGGCVVTGMHATTVYQLRQALKLDRPGTPVKVIEPYQMLGEITLDLVDTLGLDVVGLSGPGTLFGFKKEGWKPWTFFDGTPLLVPAGFNTVPEPNGDILMYPQGDRSARPSGRMPAGGYFFDTIIRQEPIDDDHLDAKDNTEEFKPVSDELLEYLRREAERLYTQTDKAILAGFGGTSFGDIAQIPAPGLKNPKGIRDVEEWYISTSLRRNYVREVFARQCEVGLGNLEKIRQAVGDRPAVIFVSGADFGTQRGPFISVDAYRDLFKPFHNRVNDWIHAHTTWKTFCHTCGGIVPLIPDLIDAGFDILNPVQCSAAGMDPHDLKKRFGSQLSFWGGGVDTQRTLPFESPDRVRDEVRNRLRAFAPGGGFVFNAVHNIQARTPTENLLALFDTLKSCARYPVS